MDDTPSSDTPDESIDISDKDTTSSLGVDEAMADRPISEVLRERFSKEHLKSKTTLWALLAFLSLPFWFYVMWMAYLQGELTGTSPPRAQFGAGFLGGVIILYVLHEMIDRIDGGTDFILTDIKTLFSRKHVLDTLTLLLSIAFTIPAVVYIYRNTLELSGRGGASEIELAMAFLFTLSMIYITWRAFGITFLAVLLAGIGYGLFGWVISGPLGHTGISWTRMLRILVIQLDGFFGFLTQLTAAWIALFLLYAGMLKAYGAFDLILRAATRSSKYLDSGIAQTAVLASAVIGSVNGSQTANAGMTGSFTIPMMKESGIKPETAGGIESVASTSGQVLPPVMGAGAFVMATLIQGVSYVDVIIAGLIPATILMIVIVVAVHYVAAPQIEDPDMDDIFDEKLTSTEVALEGLKFGIPLALLVYLLGIVQYTVMTSAFWTVWSMVALGIVIPTGKQAFGTQSVRLTFWKFVDTLEQTVNGFREGIVVLAPVAIILASINGVVDILMATGVPGALSLTLIDLSGGVLLLTAIMGLIICILLGLGMPTTAAYTIVALLIAPTFTGPTFMLPDFSAHFFVFYAAILAGLTPPIATCVAVATGIAGSNFWRTCFEAVRISAPLFILPFSFIYHPEIVTHGGEVGTSVLLISTMILLGGLTMIHGLNYRFDRSRPVALGLRGIFFVLALVIMVHPELIVQLGALAFAGLLFLTQAATGEATPLKKLQAAANTINGRRK